MIDWTLYYVWYVDNVDWQKDLFFVGQLDRPAIINDMVEPASLPDPNSPPLENLNLCTVSGWGVTWMYSQSLSPELRSVEVELFTSCWNYYPFRITNNMICAGSRSGGRDSCQVTYVNTKMKYKRMIQDLEMDTSVCLFYTDDFAFVFAF